MVSPDSDLITVLADLPGVGLEEMTKVASLQTRRDRKYVVPIALLGQFGADLALDARVLDIDGVRSFRYESVYFDTEQLDSYRDAARSRPRRRKVRTRAYLDSERCAVEIKARNRAGQTVKHRLPYPLEHRHELTAEALRFIAEIDPTGPDASSLESTLSTAYRRTTLLIDGGASRATIDIGLRCTEPAGRSVTLSEAALIETKSTRGSTAIDRMLWGHRRRPVKVSKYCVGIAALYPELPANKWHRLLWRDLGWVD